MSLKWMVVSMALLSCLGCANDTGKADPEGDTPPPHHGPQGFRNPHLPAGGRKFRDFLAWQLGLGPKETPALPPAEVPAYHPRIVAPDLERLRNPDPQTIQVTWIGHDTFLIQVAGLNLLTDPIFSERCSPVSFLGPQRKAPPGVAFESLPRIDAVIISHNHYDHLDAPTVQRLGNGPQYFVPLGLAAWFKGLGLNNVREFDWWQAAALGPIQLTSVPAQHFSMRTPFDRNRTLWCGWVLETLAGPLYFAGCSGYSPDFQKIGAHFGPLRLALIPIGCYQPRWFMAPMHVNPPEAVRAHRELLSRQSIGIHWGTFRLTDEPMGEPPLYLEKALKEAGVPPEEFITLAIGETKVFR